MPTLFTVNNVHDWLMVLCWLAAIIGLRFVLFHSYWGKAMARRFYPKVSPDEVHKLQWEIRYQAHWIPEVERRRNTAAPVMLSEPEVKERMERYVELTKTTLVQRLGQELFSCAFCQSFWSTLLLLFPFGLTTAPIIVIGFQDWLCEIMPTALAYSYVASVIAMRLDMARGADPIVMRSDN